MSLTYLEYPFPSSAAVITALSFGVLLDLLHKYWWHGSQRTQEGILSGMLPGKYHILVIWVVSSTKLEILANRTSSPIVLE